MPAWIISKEFILYILVVMQYGIILGGDMYYSKNVIALEKRTVIFKECQSPLCLYNTEQ